MSWCAEERFDCRGIWTGLLGVVGRDESVLAAAAVGLANLEQATGGSGAMERLSVPLLMLISRQVSDEPDEVELTEEARDETGLTVTVTVARGSDLLPACL